MKQNIHATCVRLNKKGILILGQSGSGKSDLALRLIMRFGAKLVADDRVDISLEKGAVSAAASEILKGLLEARGIGILKFPPIKKTKIDLVINLKTEKIERLPEQKFYCLFEKNIPMFDLNPFEVSAAEKVVAMLSLL